MSSTLAVARDLVREAASRRWLLALGVAMTVILGALTLGLSLEVVDGALAATRFFGGAMNTDIQAADVALRPVFLAASYLIFYGGIVCGISACSDFAPGLLSPGRIEHLLSLPLSRAALLGGTYLGVLAVVGAIAGYGAVGFTLILGFKTGVWSSALIFTAVLAALAFTAIYAAMITTAVFVRSAAVSAIVGGALFILGIFAGYRDSAAMMFENGVARGIFWAVTTAVPPISIIADQAAKNAGSEPWDGRLLSQRLVGILIFAFATFAVGVWRFEGRDF